MTTIIKILKKIPLDLGQGDRRHDTAGKRIAFSFVPHTTDREKTALDIGCRDGFWSERLKKEGYTVSALDIEPHYSVAIRHDVEKRLPYEDKSFDLVWCTEVLEHLRNPEYLLSEIERVIKQDGWAILTTPNSDWWLYRIGKFWGWTPQKLQNPDHKQFFNEQDIRRLASGYELFGYFPYVVIYKKLLGKIGLLSPTFILVKRF